MATAYVEWSYGYDCDWGVTVLDGRNYSCQLRDGIHDLSASDLTCDVCDTMLDTCCDCGVWVCLCSNAKMG